MGDLLVNWILKNRAYRERLTVLARKYELPLGVRGEPVAYASLAANAYRDMLRSGAAKPGDMSAADILRSAIRLNQRDCGGV